MQLPSGFSILMLQATLNPESFVKEKKNHSAMEREIDGGRWWGYIFHLVWRGYTMTENRIHAIRMFVSKEHHL